MFQTGRVNSSSVCDLAKGKFLETKGKPYNSGLLDWHRDKNLQSVLPFIFGATVSNFGYSFP